MAWLLPWAPRQKGKRNRPGLRFHVELGTALQRVCGAPSWLQSFEKVSSFVFLETEDLCPLCRGLLGSLPYHRPGLDWFHENSPCGPQSDDSGGDWPLVLHAHRLFNDESDVRDWSRLVATEPEPEPHNKEENADADADTTAEKRR